MAEELPARVEPADESVRVSYPWNEAAAALTALNVAAATLRSQLSARPGMDETLEDWEGSYRVDFDVANFRITAAAGGLADEITLFVGRIVGSAENANQLQRNLNAQATSSATRN
jgi:hypothetical protein